MSMRWQKPAKETEGTQWWTRMTLGDPSGGGFGGGPFGPDSNEVLNVFLFFPFWLVFQLVALPVRVCLYLLRLKRKATGAGAPR